MHERSPKVKQAFFRDIRISLVTWVVLELLCFGLMPLAQVYPRSNVEPLFWPSIVLGIAGILVLSLSSGAVEDALTITERQPQVWRRRIAKVTSILGLIGITFPMALIMYQFGIAIRDYEG
ncbi:MAG: hypothetical protein AAFY57_06965 [Cyanobacteria bacterium J06642_2]